MSDATASRKRAGHRKAGAESPGLGTGWPVRIAAMGLFIAGWQWLGNDQVPFSLPTFTRTMEALVDLARDDLGPAFLRSNQALALGFGMSLLFSISLGAFMGLVNMASRVILPYVTVMVAVPTIALIPLVQSVFGLSLLARAIVVFLFSFAYITNNTYVAVSGVRTDLKEMATSFGAKRRALIRHVIMPASVPGVLAGVRLGLGRALVGMVIAELTLVGAGIGSLLAEAQGRVRLPDVMAISLAVVIEGALLMGIVGMIEKRFTSWEGKS